MSKKAKPAKPARKVKGASPDIFDRVAREMFTPGGPRHGGKPVAALRLMNDDHIDTGCGWCVEAFADYLRKRLSPLPPKRKASK